MIFQKLTMKTTGLVVVILIIVLGIYDLIAVISNPSLSVSQFLINVGFKAPVVVFAFGFTAGHVFGYMTLAKEQ